MALSLGTTTLTALYLGTTAISAAYLGATQVYSTTDAYAIGGASPKLVAAFTTQSDSTTAGEYFRKASSETTFDDLFTFSRSGTATYFDSNGTLQTAADGVVRRNAYYYNGSAWVKGGLRLESAAATQLLHGTDSFATQDETVTAQAYTLQFRGTGSITLSGAHSATLNGTGANDLVSLTFTPSAGTLTLTPSGTVNYPQLETGSIPTSYIPNTAGSGTVTRAAETLSIAGADTPANTTAMSISMKGLMTYADNGAAAQETFLRWYADANNYITLDLDTDSTATGEVNANQSTAGTLDTVVAGAEYSPGVNVAFNIASRHTSGAVNVAKDGTAAAADTTPTALADLSSAALTLGQTFNGFISEFRMWGTDIGDSGIAAVTAEPLDPASLFASGENGVWYEPSTTTAFRSTTDLTPCAVGESCGFLLDKSQGARYSGGAFTGLGSELVTGDSSTFASSLGSWTYYTGATASVAGGNFSISTTGAYVLSGILTLGKFYHIEFDWTRSLSSSIPYVGDRAGPGSQIRVPVGGALSGTATGIIQCAFAQAAIGSASGAITIDNISIREIPGLHATQGTAAARPLLQQTAGGVYYLDDDEVDDALNWTAPADTDYTIAHVNSSGTVTILTGQSLSGATDILLDPALVAYIAVNRALAAGETSGLTAYLEALA